MLVIGIFAWSAQPGILESETGRAEDSYYNLLVQGFRAGQLNVKREAPPELAHLANPYDPAVNYQYAWQADCLCYEMSYYKGKLYLYFGVTPALVLFWPYTALTGHYLTAKVAVVIFFALGFLIAAGLLNAIWRRYFPETSVWITAACLLALGLATGMLEILSSCDVHEVAKSCAFMFTMLALAGIWCALHEAKHSIKWLALASLAYGLAVGSRPTLLYAAFILLIPVAYAWNDTGRRSFWQTTSLFLAATVPMVLVGLGLMLYNFLRFGNPFEFGWHYQMTNIDQHYGGRQFNLHYLWFNFRFYFLEPMRWIGSFPYLQAIPTPPLPPGHGGIGAVYSGILWDYPIVWLALAAPLAWKTAPGRDVSALRYFSAAIFSLFFVCAATMCLFLIASSRYQFDFLPALIFLAVVGIFGVEHALAGSPAWRRAARCGWCLLLAYTLVFGALAGAGAHEATDYFIGNSFLNRQIPDRAIGYFQKALALEPNSADTRFGLGDALHQEKRIDEAIVQFQKVLALKPDFAKAWYNYGYCLYQKGQLDEAMVQCQKAINLKPDDALYHNFMGNLLLRKRRIDEAISQYQTAVKLKPDYAEALNNLAYLFFCAGRTDEAIAGYQQAAKYDPKNPAVYFNLGNAFHQKLMATNAMDCYQKAIALEPQFTVAQVSLAWMLATWPDDSIRDGSRAVALARQADKLTGGGVPEVLRALAAAYAETGDFSDAIVIARKGAALAAEQSNAPLAQALENEMDLYQNNSPCRTTGN